MKIKIAIPSKGRISDPAVAILEKAGLGLKDASNRKLFSNTHNSDISVMFARAADIPEFVADGIVDMGITGLDLIKESNSDVEILTDLKFGQTSLVLASPEDSDINSLDDIKSEIVVATEFPNLTDSYLKSHGINAKIVELTGSTEIAPFIGIADIIADLTSTGTTLKMNHLKIIDNILDSSIKLIANKDEYFNNNEKKNLIGTVNISINGVIEAERKKLLMMNVSKDNLQIIKDLMPSMTGPTVSEVLSDREDTVAVQAVVDEEEVFDLVNKLKNSGARDILVVPIERII
ncbi:ATP phosphoribosyltransferase [Methanobrevibacter arboriphilus JCM 13429 = DSM 1125]|uniref:ATP phosphoribosyltransferase n=1 Tax=Methanobrevibacter arboriphilus JCM 13429 = DSM 1125 TaxID=1300164 RepID=A0A1V6N1F8_METAZ|nr:ATP phosphoribosyltransferase [Methanobrevibacter arboriphilus]OQD58529.1 ATP phosphoribosyltransferase [Methanobrevibacter arboriphilus JCM 13429 = DSM 1125]